MLGSPLTAAMSRCGAGGWRWCVTVAAAVTVAARTMLPEMVLSTDQLAHVGPAGRVIIGIDG